MSKEKPIDLVKATSVELKEMLDRQKKLFDNKKFVNSLPDKGKKIECMISKMEQEFHRRNDIEQTTAQLANIVLDPEVQQRKAAMLISSHEIRNPKPVRRENVPKKGSTEPETKLLSIEESLSLYKKKMDTDKAKQAEIAADRLQESTSRTTTDSTDSTDAEIKKYIFHGYREKRGEHHSESEDEDDLEEPD